MCGRFYLDEIPLEDWGLMGVGNIPDFSFKNYNVTPGSPIPIVHQEQGQRIMDPAIWGLLPEWAMRKDMKPMINARAETAASKPYFRGAYKHHRCLIPASGFYEWHRVDNHKIPHVICIPERKVMVFAGLYEVDLDNNLSCAILTIAANPQLQAIHSRMPVILEPEHFNDWIKTGDQELLAPYNHELSIWPVSSRVNNTGNNDVSLLQRA